jgi:hypothetical protein
MTLQLAMMMMMIIIIIIIIITWNKQVELKLQLMCFQRIQCTLCYSDDDNRRIDHAS